MGYELVKPLPEIGHLISHVKRVSDGAMVPVDLGNPDFREFLAWNYVQPEPLPWHLPWVDEGE